MLLIWICGAGILAGLVCNVLALLPLSLASVVLVVAGAWLSGSGAHLPDVLMAVIACQAGYMLGLTGRDALAQVVARIGAAPSNRA
ncbi:MAG: hypothetical protein ACLP8B_27450 [Xanthobacteraceae bacterium]